MKKLVIGKANLTEKEKSEFKKLFLESAKAPFVVLPVNSNIKFTKLK